MSRVAHRSCGAPRNRAARSRHCPHPKPTRSERDGDGSRRQLPAATSISLPWKCKRGSSRWTRRHHAIALQRRARVPLQTLLFPSATPLGAWTRSEEHTSELQSLMRISYAVFCLKKTKKISTQSTTTHIIEQINKAN